MKITKSILKKIIKEEILREMMSNQRVEKIRNALTTNRDLPFKEFENPIEAKYVIHNLKVDSDPVVNVFEKLNKEETVLYSDITPKFVMTLMEKPNLFFALAKSYGIQVKIPDDYLFRWPVSMSLNKIFSGGDREKIDIYRVELNLDTEGRKVRSFMTYLNGDVIGTAVSDTQARRVISSPGGETVNLRTTAPNDPVFQKYLSGKSTKQVVDELEKELGAKKAFEQFQNTVEEVEHMMVWNGRPGFSAQVPESGVGGELSFHDFSNYEEDITREHVLKYIPSLLLKVMEPDDKLRTYLARSK